MANIIKLGSLYLGDQQRPVGKRYLPDSNISIGDTIIGQEISWVVVDQTLIADRCILTNVSWDDLNSVGLIFGKRILIDGFSYTIMVPSSTVIGGISDEWETAMAAVNDDSNSLWHWKGVYCWGKESNDSEQRYRVVRGYYAGHGWSYSDACQRRDDIGYRPMLRPDFCDSLPDLAPYSEMILWLGKSVIHGRLFEVTDYDVVLVEMPGTHIAGSDIGTFVKPLPDGRLIVERSRISTVQLQATGWEV